MIAMRVTGRAEDLVLWKLVPQTQVTASGVFLDQVLADGGSNGVPHVRTCDAPAVGKGLYLASAQIQNLATNALPSIAGRTWAGSPAIQITRRMRQLGGDEILDSLTSLLQKQQGRDQGQIELRWARPWTPVLIGDESYTLKLVDFPSAGLTPNLLLRFELVADRESLGSWQVVLDARLMRQAWVVQTSLKRGDAIQDSDFSQEPRDVLRQRDLLGIDFDLSKGWIAAENLNQGQPLLRRSVQLRAVVQRGQVVDALVKDGAITISLKAEVLDSGVPGQIIRLRNPISRRELRGKVINEQMVQIQL